MMMAKVWLGAAAAVMTMGSAQAATVFTKAIETRQIWASSTIAGNPPAIVYDAFTLAGPSGYAVNGATWQGSYYDLLADAFTGAYGRTQTFRIDVYTDAAGGPALDASDNGLIARRYVTATASDDFYGRFGASFDAITLAGNTPYWLSIFAVDLPESDVWGWGATPDSGNAVQVFGTETYVRNSELVFSLAGDAVAVPEPATWAMMLLGFGMVAGAARYRRRRTGVAFG